MDDNEWFCAGRNPFEPKPFWIEEQAVQDPCSFFALPAPLTQRETPSRSPLVPVFPSTCPNRPLLIRAA